MSQSWTETYSDKPARFLREVLGREVLTSQQYEVLRRVRDAFRGDGPPFLALPAGNGLGKTFLMADVAIWAPLCTATKLAVITTAPTWAQVEGQLWRYINEAASAAQLPGKYLSTSFELINGNWGVGLSTNEAVRFQGYHAPRMLIILDEGPGVEPDIWQVILRRLAVSDGVVVIAIGNPVDSGGPFYDAATKGGRWSCLYLSCLEHPNVIQRREVIPGAVSFGSVKEMIEDYCEPIDDPGLIAHLERLQKEVLAGERAPLNKDAHQVGDAVYWFGAWCKPSTIVQSAVLGVFPDEGEDTLIPMRWIVRAMERGKDVLRRIELLRAGKLNASDVPEWDAEAGCVTALDVARYGPDSTVMGARRGRVVLPLEETPKSNTQQTAGRFVNFYHKHGSEYGAVDIGAMGWGVVDGITEQESNNDIHVIPVDFGKAPADDMRKVQYLNKRAQMYWNLRCLLEKDEIDLPDDERLKHQLAVIRYTHTNRGQIQIESKKDMKKRGEKSPDRADCLAMLCDDTLNAGNLRPEDWQQDERVQDDYRSEAARVAVW